MKLGKALRLVLSRWNMTHYRLAKASDVGQATIGKLVRGDLESSTWDVVERLANGFEKLDPMAKIAFLGVLQLPDSAYPASLDNPDSMPTEPYDSINAEAVEILNEKGFLNLEVVEKSGLKISGNEFFDHTLGDWITLQMYKRRRKEIVQEDAARDNNDTET